MPAKATQSTGSIRPASFVLVELVRVLGAVCEATNASRAVHRKAKHKLAVLVWAFTGNTVHEGRSAAQLGSALVDHPRVFASALQSFNKLLPANGTGTDTLKHQRLIGILELILHLFVCCHLPLPTSHQKNKANTITASAASIKRQKNGLIRQQVTAY